jgi:hypothetical protein
MGLADPHPHNSYQASKAYGMTAAELGLEANALGEEVQPLYADVAQWHDEDSDSSLKPLTEAMQHDVELHLQCLIYDWLHRKKFAWPLAKLQDRLGQEIESYDHMDNHYLNHEGVDLGRRDALRRLVLLSLQAFGLGTLGLKLCWAAEDMLTHCAAGITACGYLSKGQHEDMAFAFSALSAYFPSLRALTKESSLHRQEAANLISQCLQLKAILAYHLESSRQAISYAKQAVSYARESGNRALWVMALRQLSSAYYYDSRHPEALLAAQEAQALMEQAQEPVVPLAIQSWVYSGLARSQARHGGEPQAILTSLGKTYETFSSLNENVPGFLDHNQANLILQGGLAHSFRGQQQEALDAFAQIIDLNDNHFHAKLPASRRTHIETVNHAALASLKLPKERKDLERSVTLWKAGIQGAVALRSEQRFKEALSAYEIMDALWSGDKRIMELRDLTHHW